MKKISSIIILFVGLTAWGQDCSSPSAVTHYKIERVAKKKKQLQDPEFLNGLKADLIRQIYQTVTVSDKSITSVANGKETNHYSSKVDISASGLIINPSIDICDDVITISIEKKYMHDLARDYLTQVIKADNKSLETILEHGVGTNSKFIKNQLKTYNTKKVYYEALVPLALQSKKDFSIDRFSEFKMLLKQLEIKETRIYSVPKTKVTTRVSKPKTSGYYRQKTDYKKASFNTWDKVGWVNVYAQGSGGYAYDKTREEYNTAITSHGYGIDIGNIIVVGLQNMTTNTHTKHDGVEGLLPESFETLYYTAGFGLSGINLYYKQAIDEISMADFNWSSSGIGFKCNFVSGEKYNKYKGLGFGGYFEVMNYRTDSQYGKSYKSFQMGLSLAFIF